MLRLSALATALLLSLLPAMASAQLGRITFGPLDMAAATGAPLGSVTPNTGFMGVTELNGLLYVSCRGRVVGGAWVNTGPHTVFVLDGTGAVINSYPQDVQTATLTWGYRDGATDQITDTSGNITAPGAVMFFGTTTMGIFCVDPATGALTNTYQATAGAQILAANPIPISASASAAGVLTNYGVAYDPNGNGGLGSWWTGGFASSLVEIDSMGNVLTQYPNQNWSIRGLALDPMTGNLWLQSSGGNRGDIVEVDLASGLETGKRIIRHKPGSLPGGLSEVVGGMGGSGNALDLIGVDNSVPDSITAYRAHLHSSVLGTTEARLVAQVGGSVCGGAPSALDTETKTYLNGETLTWGYDASADPTLPGRPAILLANVDIAALGLVDASATGITLGIPEFDAVSMMSVPAGQSPFILGDGFGIGAMAGSVLALGPHALGAPDVSFSPPLAMSPGDGIRLQAVYFDAGAPSTPVVATNAVRFLRADILVEAAGHNSFNTDVTQGFLKIRHLNPSLPSIVEVTVDLSPISPVAMFDADEPGFGPTANDQFWNGNTTDPNGVGCAGTYRNGCDVSTGLIYDNLTTYGPDIAAGQVQLICDQAANCGFIASNPVTGIHRWRTLTFRFTPGSFTCDTFEFDVDTDGGRGVSGRSQAGMAVSILLDDNTLLTGTLETDPSNRLRSMLVF